MDTMGTPAQQVDGAQLLREPARSSRAVLAWVVGIGASGLALSVMYTTTGLGFGCPLKSITGWDCPLCGGTRMGAALLRGDVASAWHLNAFALIGIVIGALAGIALVAERIARRPGSVVRASRSAAGRLPFAVTGRGLAFAFIAACLVWLVFRNLVLGPLP